MATDALRAQVAAKWQDAFTRLNRGEPGITGLLAFSQAWTTCLDFLRPGDLNDPDFRKPDNLENVRAAFEVLNQCRRLPAMLETFLEDVRKSFHLINREVLEYMSRYEEASDPRVIALLVYRLVDWYNAWQPHPDLGLALLSAYTTAFQTHLMSILPPTFARGFKALCASTLQQPGESANANMLVGNAIWAALETLGLVDRYESLIASVGYECIEAHVISTCSKKWTEPMLGGLRDWMTNRIVPWMLWPYARGASSTEEARNMLQGVGSRFDFHMNKTLCDLRTREIFDIIIDFPESTPALHDLRECLLRVDQRADLVQALRKAHKKRLLHPGADTKLILSQYVSTIKCLRIVDPPGVLLFKVADPIRRYLRERPDTIRSIVANLVGDDDSGDSLVDENEPIQPLQHADAENYSDPNWEPEPIDAGPDFRTNKPSDVISTLVSIYDSQDLFVTELQVLLAQRLLAIKDGNFEKERRNVEILKVRFGESALQVCEVMLKDMTDSQRIDQHVQSQKASIVHPIILSRHFWPTLESADIVMPGQFQTLLDQYSNEFTNFKPDKKLRWLTHLGTVHVELELADRTVDVHVPPLEAAFIELFSEKALWTVDDLVSRVGSIDRGAALKALMTWIDLGVLKEESENTFQLLETVHDGTTSTRTVASKPARMEETPTVASAKEQQIEQMMVYWKYIEGMLTNLGALPLDRIQASLRFVPGYDRSIDDLTAIMEAAQKHEKIVHKGGLWRLKRQ